MIVLSLGNSVCSGVETELGVEVKPYRTRGHKARWAQASPSRTATSKHLKVRNSSCSFKTLSLKLSTTLHRNTAWGENNVQTEGMRIRQSSLIKQISICSFLGFLPQVTTKPLLTFPFNESGSWEGGRKAGIRIAPSVLVLNTLIRKLLEFRFLGLFLLKSFWNCDSSNLRRKNSLPGWLWRVQMGRLSSAKNYINEGIVQKEIGMCDLSITDLPFPHDNIH